MADPGKPPKVPSTSKGETHAKYKMLAELALRRGDRESAHIYKSMAVNAAKKRSKSKTEKHKKEKTGIASGEYKEPTHRLKGGKTRRRRGGGLTDLIKQGAEAAKNMSPEDRDSLLDAGTDLFAKKQGAPEEKPVNPQELEGLMNVVKSATDVAKPDSSERICFSKYELKEILERRGGLRKTRRKQRKSRKFA